MILTHISHTEERYFVYSRWDYIAVSKGGFGLCYGYFLNKGWKKIERRWNDDTWREITEDEARERVEALKEGQQ